MPWGTKEIYDWACRFFTLFINRNAAQGTMVRCGNTQSP